MQRREADGVDADVVSLVAGSTASIVDDAGDIVTAGELVDQARRLAGWLASDGLRRGDRLAVRWRNDLDHLRLLVACAVGGHVAVAVNTRWPAEEAAELVERTGAVRLVDGDGEGGQTVRAGRWRAHAPAEVVGDADDGYVVFTTSGTTSRPKLVLHRQRSIAHHAVDVAAGFGYQHDDVALVAMPLCGTFGLTSLTGALAADARVVLTDFDVARTAATIERERVTVANGSDDMFHRLLEHGADLSSIRCGGYARFNSSLDGIVERADAVGATLVGLYGMSEVQALFSRREPTAPAGERARAGGALVSAGAALRVVDGELQLRGPSCFAGYLAEGGERIDDELTARHHDDGWFRTGDVAVADDDRTFHFVGRMGDTLRLGGFLVDPAEIAAVVRDVAGAEAAQVVAVDRPTGARPVAFVLAPGGVDEAAVIAGCRDRLARYKVPVRVVAVDAFPTTPSANGTKVRLVELRERATQLFADHPDV